MDNLTDSAPMGHNKPPLVDPDLLAQSRHKVDDFAAKATEWLNLGEITTKEQSGNLVDFISGARLVSKRIDEARVAAKKPHDEASKAVQAVFTPLIAEIDRAVDRLKPLQAAWLRKEQARLDAIREAQRAEAERLRIAAESAAAIAKETNSIGGEVEAERLAKEAEVLEKTANREMRANATSASGAGRTMANREVKSAKIDNILKLFTHFRAEPEVFDLLQRMANRAVRAGEISAEKAAEIGITIYSEARAA